MDSRHCMKSLHAVQIAMIRFVGEMGGTPYDSMEKLKIQFFQEIYAIFGRLLDGTGGLYVSVTYPLLIQLIYMLWFNKFYFICGLKFYFLLYIVTQKQRKIKFKPGIKLDDNREI